ncbi:MAG: hypothetical protein LBK99_18415 [Opitutaceae bacterium]|jgi:hypothetical protein|nr:hypothetical protein [Opitutaceae bacterium]
MSSLPGVMAHPESFFLHKGREGREEEDHEDQANKQGGVAVALLSSFATFAPPVKKYVKILLHLKNASPVSPLHLPLPSSLRHRQVQRKALHAKPRHMRATLHTITTRTAANAAFVNVVTSEKVTQVAVVAQLTPPPPPPNQSI